jgi:hypothetical protein
MKGLWVKFSGKALDTSRINLETPRAKGLPYHQVFQKEFRHSDSRFFYL